MGAKLRTILRAAYPGGNRNPCAGDTRSEARTPAYVAGIEHNGDIILDSWLR